jgi:hypothetical protein
MISERVRLGELLVSAKLISQGSLDEALAIQKRDGRRLGTILVEQGFVSEAHVTQLLGQQLSVPWVSLHHIDLTPALLALVPAELAERCCLIPIHLRKVRGLGNVLYVAMDDPSNRQVVEEVAQTTGLPIRTMIAPPSDIRAALYREYGVGEAPPKPKPRSAKGSRQRPPPPSTVDLSEELSATDVVTLPPPRNEA